MTQKNAFLAFVHKHIDEFTPQQMEAATRLLNDKPQPGQKIHTLHKEYQPKVATGEITGPEIRMNLPVFDVDAIQRTLASMGGSNMSKNLTTHITYTNGT